MKRSLFALALAAALPFSAQANDSLSYTYVQLDYVDIDSDFDGWGLRGSYEFHDNWYAFGGLQNTSLSGFDLDPWTIGVGYHHAATDKTDLTAELSYIDYNSDVGSFVDESAWRISAGVRSEIINDHFEGIAKLNYTNGGEWESLDSNVSGTLGLLGRINEMWSISGEYEFGTDGAFDTATIGVRASF
jgi:Ax21 family sulfation-dependent quorum factor